MYFFVRDICHQHQHHGADADTIITTQKDKNNDFHWANNIIYGLYLYMINAKRRSETLEQVRVLGVLAYVKAFKKIIDLRTHQRSLPASVPQFDDASLAESIDATKNYIELVHSRREQRIEQSRTVVLAVGAGLFSLFTFISGFADPDVKAPQYIINTANFLKNNALLSLSPVAIMIMWWASSRIVRPKYDFKRDVIRLAIINRSVFVVGLVVVAIILMHFAWRMLPFELLNVGPNVAR